MKQSVLNNTAYLIAAFIGQKILSFLFFTLIARQVGVDITGSYIFAFSYTSFFAVFIDIGFSSFLIRELARDKERAGALLGTIIGTKAILGAVVAAIVLITLPFLNKSDLVNTMVYLAVVVMVLDSFTLTFWGVFRGFQNLRYEGFNVVIAQLVILAAGTVSLVLKLPAFYLVLAVMSGSVYQFLSSLFLIKYRLKLPLRPRLNPRHVHEIFKVSYPFALSLILTRFYTYFDQIILSLMKGEYDLGIYGVPYKLTFALQFIPGALGSALFPAISDNFINDKAKLAALYERAVFYLLIVAVPLAVGIGVLAEPIILTVYGQQYASSVLPLRIMIGALVFIFLAFPNGALLNGTENQSRQSFNLFLTLLTNIILNVLLIPRYSYLGASIAIVASMAMLYFAGLQKVGKIIDYNYKHLALQFLKTAFSSAIMGAIVWGLYQIGPDTRLYNCVLLPVVGAVVYLVVMLFTGGIHKENILALKAIVLRRRPV